MCLHYILSTFEEKVPLFGKQHPIGTKSAIYCSAYKTKALDLHESLYAWKAELFWKSEQ